ncbi:MAG: hypothetical protein ABIP71_02495 [Verrucomicrobiota bacterium]
MNAAIISMPSYGYQGQDFTGSVVESTRRLRAASLAFFPLAAEPFFPASLAPTGISESVNRIMVGRSAALSPSLRKRIGELSDLKPSWDGETAKSVKAPVLGDVVEVLRRLTQCTKNFREPFLAPTFDGFVQIEWHIQKRSLEIEAVSQGWSVVGSMIVADGKRLYFPAECERSDFEQLEKFYEWFAGNELLWPSQ